MITNAFGYIGGFLLALCGLPEAITSILMLKTFIGWPMLLMWFGGEVFTLIYAWQKNKQVDLLPLLLNYGLNIVFISIMIVVKLGEL